MDRSLNSGVKLAFSRVDSSRLNRTKLPKTQQSVSKVLASAFWEALCNDYFKKGRTINSEYYIALLVRLKEEIAKNGHK